jgi:hypothetical protein
MDINRQVLTLWGTVEEEEDVFEELAPVLATWHIRSKKSDLHLSDRAFPWAQNSFEGQGKPCSSRWIARGNIHQARQTDIC